MDTTMLILDVDFIQLKQRCLAKKWPLWKSLSGVVSCAICVLSLFLFVYCKWKWHIKWRWYKLKRLFKRKRNQNTLIQHESTELPGELQRHFDAYVVFAFSVDVDRTWVFQVLQRYIETNMGYSLYLRGRDDEPGEFEANNITDGIESTSIGIWIISDTFTPDPWWEFAANFSLLHHRRENIIILRFGSMDFQSLPRCYRKLLNPKRNMLSLNIPDDTIGNQLTWEEVKDFLSLKCQ
jgi:hypothetical protein